MYTSELQPLGESKNRAKSSYHQHYYQKHSAELKDRAKKRRQASQRHVSFEVLERLRIPDNRFESLRYGPEEKSVCLECGLIGEALTHHIRRCPAKAQSSSAYTQRWGFEKSSPLTSPKQREAYSQIRRRSVTFEGRRTNALKHRGKRTGARPQLQKVSDSKIYEIFALGLSITEGAKRAGISRIGFYKRAQSLGLDLGALRRQQLQFVRLASNLRKWIALQPQIPTAQQVMQHMDDLCSGSLRPSPELPSPELLLSFRTHLKAELQKRPDWIAEIAVEIAEKKPAQKVLSLANRIFQRLRGGDSSVLARSGRKIGRRPGKLKTTRAERTTRVPKYRRFGESVMTLLPDIQQAHAVLRMAKKNNPTNSSTWVARLREANCPEGAIPFVVSGRTAKVAAIRYAAQLQKIKPKTAQNLFSQYLASSKSQSAGSVNN